MSRERGLGAFAHSLASGETNPGLTWGVDVSGEAFVSKAAQYGALEPRSRVLGVGPGYGRLLLACLQRGASFGAYIGG